MDFKIEYEPEQAAVGTPVILTCGKPHQLYDYIYQWEIDGEEDMCLAGKKREKSSNRVTWITKELEPGKYKIRVTAINKTPEKVKQTRTKKPEVIEATVTRTITLNPAAASVPVKPASVSLNLQRSAAKETADLPLWVVIRKSTGALLFENYQRFVDHVLCGEDLPANCDGSVSKYEAAKLQAKAARFNDDLVHKRFLPFNDVEAYRLLKAATEAFVMVNCGVVLSDAGLFDPAVDDIDVLGRVEIGGQYSGVVELWDRYLARVNGTNNLTLPYLGIIRRKLKDLDLKDGILSSPQCRDDGGDHDDGVTEEQCIGIIREKLTSPCLIELIWSYWHEEGMLVQTLNAISRRFQNIRGMGKKDPLANMEIDNLRPMANLLWGMVQDEQHRLSIKRRTYEYSHHYGLTLLGNAVGKIRPADDRSKFLEAFHTLLHITWLFYQQDDDTMVIADGFPVLNALKEVHLLLTQGMHNQYGDLPSTARIEMLMQQWILARPEMREFLALRRMVAYPEPWMDAVESMKRLQPGWTDTSIIHFNNLAVFGERLLLSIRFGNWNSVNERAQAVNWARYWREEIQGYIHAYRVATGVDLTADLTTARVDATLPGLLIKRRTRNRPAA